MENEISAAEALEVLAGHLAAKIAPQLAPQLAALQSAQSERPEWYSVKQAAAEYRVSEDTIRNALKVGALHKHTRGQRSVALHRDDLDRYFGAERS